MNFLNTRPERFEMFEDHIQPLRALTATLRLIANKEDTAEVYRVTAALDGPRMEATYQAYIADPRGRALLDQPRELRETMSDRAWLESLPTDTLGRAYLDFVTAEGLSPQGFQDEMNGSGESFEQAGPDRQKFMYRMRHTHDLLHVLTGYGRDMIGEIALLEFTRGFSGSRAFQLITALGQFKARSEFKGLPVRACMKEGHRLGREATIAFYTPWEEYLAMPVEKVRRELNIARPEIYLSIKDRARDRDAAYREELAATHGAMAA